MKYEILFFTFGCGVFTKHNTLEAAQNHATMLTSDIKGAWSWTISHNGQVIKEARAGKV